MRRNVCPGMAFSNGNYIFDSNMQQIDPKDPQGIIIESILVRQHKDRVDSREQKYRAEVAHNKDINNDGIIGDPNETSKTLRKRVDKAIKAKKKTKPTRALKVSSSSDVAVSDSSNKVQEY